MPKLPRIKCDEALRIFIRCGFVHVRTGHHHILRNADGITISVPNHKKAMGIGLLSKILKDANLTADEFIEKQ